MSIELFITNLDFLTKLQAILNFEDFILNFNTTQINVQGGIFDRDARRSGPTIFFVGLFQGLVPK